MTRPKTPEMQRAEKMLQEPIEAYLERELQTHSQAEVARRLGINPSTLSYWLIRLGFYRQTTFRREEK